MNAADAIGLALLGSGCAIALLATFRGNGRARAAIRHFTEQRGWRPGAIRRRWLDRGPFGSLYRNVSVFKVIVTDGDGRTFIVWFHFEHDLLGAITATETKFDHAGRP